MATTPIYTLDFGEIGLKDAARVGGENASLGQLFKALKPLGVGALDGFATTPPTPGAGCSSNAPSNSSCALFL
jgi:pyruvate,water dikinase